MDENGLDLGVNDSLGAGAPGRPGAAGEFSGFMYRARAFESALRSRLAERDASGLAALAAANPEAASVPWIQDVGGNKLSTLALPEAVRMGWLEGVNVLLASGADPSRVDADRQGFGDHGRPPLAEAVWHGRFEIAQALLDAGASMSPLGSLLVAVAMRARRAGIDQGVQAFQWLKARGFEPWADDQSAKSAQAAFLSMGCRDDGVPDDRRRAWDDMIFEGAGDGPGAADCMWHYAMGSANAGAPISSAFLRRWMDQGGGSRAQERAQQLLEWGLESMCVDAARAGAAELAFGADWKSCGGAALERACAERRACEVGASAAGPERLRRAEREAFDAYWDLCGAKAKDRPRLLDKAAFNAMKSGRFGFLEGLVQRAGVQPMDVAAHWRASGPSPFERGGRVGFWDEGIAILAGAAMASAPHAERSGDALLMAEHVYEAFTGWDGNSADRRSSVMEAARGEAARMLAARMRSEVACPSAAAPAKAARL